MERRSLTKSKKSEIVRYLFEHKNASKTELTKALAISMPTVLQATNELLEQGILQEVGEYESTGGRRAKSLALNSGAAHAVGLDITTNRISFVLVNFVGEIVHYVEKKKIFVNNMDYYREVADELNLFLQEVKLNMNQILGVGVSLPGILDSDEKILIKSNILKLDGISLKMLENFVLCPVHYVNDANAAMMMEWDSTDKDAVYLFLSNTVGGAFRIDRKVFLGINRMAGEFDHMIIVPGGRPCYCGKKGCAYTYCSGLALEQESGMPVEELMERVAQHDSGVMQIWDEYLEYLAVMIANLRTMFDSDIIIGGDVGAYLEDHMFELGKKVMKYNTVDSDISYLKNSIYKKGGAAAGAALYYILQFMDHIS